MLKFARKRSSSTDRELVRDRSSVVSSRQRSSSVERTQNVVKPSPTNQSFESPARLEKIECGTVTTAVIKRLGHGGEGGPRTSLQLAEKRNSALVNAKATFAPLTTTLSHLMSQVQINVTPDDSKPPPVLPRRPKVEHMLHHTGHLWGGAPGHQRGERVRH